MTWPYTTPSGHTYREPTTFADLRERAVDNALGYDQHWDPAEMPPAPTWEMVGIAIDERNRMLAALPSDRFRRVVEAAMSVSLPDGWWAEVRNFPDGVRLGVIGTWGMQTFIPSTDGTSRWYVPYLDPQNHLYDKRMEDSAQAAIDLLIAEFNATVVP